MAKIKPFCGIRYNAKKTGSLSKVLCPPYDVINKQQRKAYIEKSPHNIVSVILPDAKSKIKGHRKARTLLQGWLSKGILLRDKKPSIYVYQQAFKIGKTTKSRIGFLSLLEIEGEKTVLPHEKIFDKFKFERASLMNETQAHLSPIFMFFNDDGCSVGKLLASAVKKRKPQTSIKFEDAEEKLWSISDEEFMTALRNLMQNKKAFIADGHHRFEASLHLKECMRAKAGSTDGKMPYDYTLVYFLSMQDSGLTILPTHRAVKKLPVGFSKDFMLRRLSKYFFVKIKASKEQLIECLEEADKAKKHAFGFFYDNAFIFILLKDEKIVKTIGPPGNSLDWKKLDVSILHYFILPELLGIEERVKGRRNIYYYRGKPKP